MNNETNKEPVITCRFCGKEIKHFHGRLYHEVSAVVFPQYCTNSDPEKAAVMHIPLITFDVVNLDDELHASALSKKMLRLLESGTRQTLPVDFGKMVGEFEQHPFASTPCFSLVNPDKAAANNSVRVKSRWSPEEFDRAAADIGVDPKVLQKLIAAESASREEADPRPVLGFEQIMSNPELRKEVAAKYAAYQLKGKGVTLFESLNIEERIEVNEAHLNDLNKGTPLMLRGGSIFDLAKMLHRHPPNGYKTNVRQHIIQKAFAAGGVVQEDGTIRINLETTEKKP